MNLLFQAAPVLWPLTAPTTRTSARQGCHRQERVRLALEQSKNHYLRPTTRRATAANTTCIQWAPPEGLPNKANRSSRSTIPTNGILCIRDRSQRVEGGRLAPEPHRNRPITPTYAALLLRTDRDERCCEAVHSV